jgi:hypothetical protein
MMTSSNYSPTFEPRLRVTNASVPDSLDLLVVALGYEERSVYVATQMSERAGRNVALAFDSTETLSYGENVATLVDLGFDLVAVEPDVGVQLVSLIGAASPVIESIGFDVSSFTRLQIAQIVDALSHVDAPHLKMVFLYAPAASDGWGSEARPITVASPVHPAFTSWMDDPALPLSAVIGVGVENNLALGVAEYLDVSSVHAFVPVGGDPGFDALNEAANQEFFLASYLVRRSEYDIQDAFRLFTRIESLIYGIAPESRVAVVPLGPKIFALCAILAVAMSDRAATVWRFSSAGGASPSDRSAAGPIVALVVHFGHDVAAAQLADPDGV